MNPLRTIRRFLVPTLLVVGLVMPAVCAAQSLLGPGVRRVTIDEAKLRRHVMRPQHLTGVETDTGPDEAADIVKIRPRPIGLPPPQLDVKGFGKAIDAALKDTTAGFVLLLRQNGIPVYTHASNWAKEPSDGGLAWAPGTHMHVASVSKLMTAIAMTKLLNEKGISYDAKIIDYLPAYWQKGHDIKKITFRNLMTHTSGFNSGTSHSDYEFMKSKVAADVNLNIGHYHYENMNFGLCRILLAVINGNIDKNVKLPPGIGEDLAWDLVTITAYAQYVTDNVFTPAGVTHATLDHPAGDALAYNFPVQGPGWNSEDLSTMSGAAGWHMSANDLLDVMGTFRRKGTIMSPEKAQEMLDNGFGLDWVGKKTPAGKLYGKNGLWANGSHQAERSWVYFLPDNMEMVVLVNSTIAPGESFPPFAQIYSDYVTGEKPAITVNNVTNTCGGTLYVSGSGFWKGEQIHITVKNAPGLKSPQKIGTAVGTAKGNNGTISIPIPYSTDPYSGKAGCGKGTTATVVVTIIATGDPGHEASTEIYLRKCGITWGACP